MAQLPLAGGLRGFPERVLTVGRKLDKLGYNSIDSAELVFDDYRVPADHLIGGVEGQGRELTEALDPAFRRRTTVE